jgi:phage RecT family recombinase
MGSKVFSFFKKGKTMPDSKAIVLKTDRDIGAYLEKKKEELAKYAVRDYKQKEFFTSVILCINDNWKLQKALESGDPEVERSFYNALKKAARTGLSLNPEEGEACLAIYGKKITHQIEKNGMIRLALETKKVKYLTSDRVREGDEFEIVKQMGNETYTHKPARTERGSIEGYYAAILFNDGRSRVEYMTKTEVIEHALQYSPSYRYWMSLSDKERQEKDPPAWINSEEGMSLKTVMRRLLTNTHIAKEAGASDGKDFEDGQIVDITPETQKLSTDVI